MLFNSPEFLIFLLAVLLCYYVLARKSQNLFLLLASYVFYGWWDWRFLILIVASTSIDYLVSHAMQDKTADRRKRLLQISLIFNLGALATFKYFNFFVDSFIDLGAVVGLNLDTPALRLIPLVGISFYTFQTMSYSIDVYYRRIKPERNFFTFALFVSYFPQLVAGPIERASRLLPQFNQTRIVTADDIKSALVLILIGLFKKVVIADNAGVGADAIFSDPGAAGTISLWAGAMLFTLQIYGDFSGYSNIARGTSRLLGIKLIENFTTPFFSRNIAEFWRRWHISLSTWLRDYLYIPLGGNRRGAFSTYRNLLLTMLIGGLWHGAAWTFVIWGGLHGIYLVLHRFWRMLMTNVSLPVHGVMTTVVFRWIRTLLAVGLTFLCVTFAFVFFRAGSLDHALVFVSGMFSWQGQIPMLDIVRTLALYGLLLPLEIIQYRSGDRLLAIRNTPLLLRVALYVMMITTLFLVSDNDVPFIYFQF